MQQKKNVTKIILFSCFKLIYAKTKFCYCKDNLESRMLV